MQTGWLSTMHSMIKAVMMAAERKVTILTPPMRFWVNASTCPRRDMSCFMREWAPDCDAARHPGGSGAKDAPLDPVEMRDLEPPSDIGVERIVLPEYTSKGAGKRDIEEQCNVELSIDAKVSKSAHF